MASFIVFEGGEGSGKSTQARILLGRLNRAGCPARLTYEPGGTRLGKKIRSILLNSTGDLTSLTELLLFAASRSQLTSEVIQPSLHSGTTVICDRFSDSTIAYQGYAQSIDLHLINTLNRLATQGLRPDLVILMDAAPEIGVKRRPGRLQDRFEQEKIEFHQKVREGYLTLAKADPGRWLVVDATMTRKRIADLIFDEVRARLGITGTVK